MDLLVIPYPIIDPVALQIGPVSVRWYGLAYMAGILLGWLYGALSRLARRALWGGKSPMTVAQADDFLLWITLGIVVGGRLGFVLFYEPSYFWQNPSEIPAVWNGGMSFHGGLLGVVLAVYVFSRIKHINPLSLGDVASAATPFGLFFGRIANFINSEVVGRVTDVPWAMVFPGAGDCPRHPSQLYEAALEGIVLFIILRIATHRYLALDAPGTVFGLFLIFYGIFRSLVEEFAREPHAGHPDGCRHLHAGHRLLPPHDPHRRLARSGARGESPRSPRDGRTKPSSPALRRGRLRRGCKQRIARDGPISVADYMQACLADERDGYYTSRQPIGTAGDFVTAPEVSQIFGELLGLWAVAVWQSMGEPRPIDRCRARARARHAARRRLARLAERASNSLAASPLALVETSPVLREMPEEDACALASARSSGAKRSTTCREDARSSCSPMSSSTRFPSASSCAGAACGASAASALAPRRRLRLHRRRVSSNDDERCPAAPDGAIFETRPATASLARARSHARIRCTARRALRRLRPRARAASATRCRPCAAIATPTRSLCQARPISPPMSISPP